MIIEDKAVSVDLFHPGASPIALALARIAGIRDIVDQSTGWIPNNKSTSPGILAETLVASLLCGCRPLYKVERFWEDKAVEIFYKDEGITAQQLNDDAYARMLDQLSLVDCQNMFESVCLRMLQHHGLDIVLTHSDTTSVSVEGIYDVDQNGKTGTTDAFKIVHGHSKDHRPDLKQIKLGLSVQQEGLPLSGEMLSGNKSDQVWNPQTVQELSDLLLNKGYENVIFLADCALVSTESLRKLSEKGVQFISRLPETFGIAEELKTEAWKKESWEDLGQLPEKKTDKSCHYKAWQTKRKIGKEEYGFVVVHSSTLEERKEKTLLKAKERTQKGLSCKSEELKKKPYACEADAMREGQRLQRQAEKKGFSSEIRSRKVETEHYSHPGRPHKGEVPERRIVWHIEVEIGEMKAEVLEEKKKRASTFILVSRLKEAKSSKEILENYKNQNRVEEGFKFIKQPQYLGPIYTKKVNRVEALGYIFLMVLLLAKYLEYRVRLGMAESGGEMKVGGQKVLRPTAKTILEFLEMMLIMRVNGQWVLQDKIPSDVLNVIHWAGFDEHLYVCGYNAENFYTPRPSG
jgi:transposase